MCVPYILYFINFSGLLPGSDQNWANFGSFIGGVITSVFSFASFIILFTNYISDKEKVNKERTIEYLKHVNTFYFGVQSIIQNIEIIRQMSRHLIDNEPEYEKYSIVADNDYDIFKIFDKIEILQKHLIENKNVYYNDANKMCYDSIISKMDETLSPYVLHAEITNFMKDAVNYYYLIDEKLRAEHKELIETVSTVSSGGMNKFDIVEYVKKVDRHIISINENILNKKIEKI